MKNSGMAGLIGSTLFGFLLFALVGFVLPRVVQNPSVLRMVLWVIFAVVLLVLSILIGITWLKKRS